MSVILAMGISFKYWDDCVDHLDMEALWLIPDVSTEWTNVGETRGQKVCLSRDPDGQKYLTQNEMRAVAEITVRRHFSSKVDPDMICAIAELESDRQILASRYNKKTKDTTLGIMQILPKTAEWLNSEQGYVAYKVQGNEEVLYRPFVNVYFAAAYLKWLSNFEEKERSEEFVVRAYKGGTKKATHKSTLPYWKRYLSVKETFTSRKAFDCGALMSDPSFLVASAAPDTGTTYTYWDSRASPEDMEDMWNHPDVVKEWTKSGEKRGKVRFSHDAAKKPYVSRVEVRAIAEIILLRHFASRKVKPTVLCALAEVVSMRFVDGVKERTGLMGIDFPTALWLYNELGYRAYKVEIADDLHKPFVSMYFGAAYLAWLSEYEGRERTPQFVVQAYLGGPENVKVQETGPLWLKFEEALSNYGDVKRDNGSCSIL